MLVELPILAGSLCLELRRRASRDRCCSRMTGAGLKTGGIFTDEGDMYHQESTHQIVVIFVSEVIFLAEERAESRVSQSLSLVGTELKHRNSVGSSETHSLNLINALLQVSKLYARIALYL